MTGTSTQTSTPDSILDADTVPNENQALTCLSCGSDMKGLHCSNCGQKNDDFRRSIWSLIAEVVGSFTSLENRIWRTWVSLVFQPGRVAREFADGRRTQWSSPVRVYLAMSILLLGFMSVTGTHIFSLDIDATLKDGIEKPLVGVTEDDIKLDIKSRFFVTQKEIESRNAQRNFELLEIRLKGDNGLKLNAEDLGTDNIPFNAIEDAIADSGVATENQIEALKSEAEDVLGSDEELNLIVNGKPANFDKGVDYLIQFVRNPEVFTQSFRKRLPQLIFIMMPLTMLIGAMFIRDRKRALLYDHLVHAAYIHAIAFLCLFIGMIFSRWVNGLLLFQIIGLSLLVYLPVSVKRMFERGWVKSIWTAYGVGVIYSFILTLTLLGWVTVDMGNDFMSQS